MRQYIDTGALIALSDKGDRAHHTAMSHFSESLKNRVRFVVGKPVLIEYIDGVTQRIGKRKGIEELSNILHSRILHVEAETQDDWNAAIKHYNKYNDTGIDLTDCISFAIMERTKINTVFGFDSHFEMHGLTCVP